MRRRMPSEAGMTLVELLVVVAIIGVVMTALASMSILIVRSEGRTGNRIAESSDAQVLATWFPADVQSTKLGPGNVDLNPGASGCAGADVGESVVTLKWDETVLGSTKEFRASYRYVPGSAGSPATLVRRYCEGNAAPYPVTQELVVADRVGPKPTIATDDTTGEVTMTVTSTDGYVYSVTGTRYLATAPSVTVPTTTAPGATTTTAAPPPPECVVTGIQVLFPLPPAEILLKEVGSGSSAKYALAQDVQIEVLYAGPCVVGGATSLQLAYFPKNKASVIPNLEVVDLGDADPDLDIRATIEAVDSEEWNEGTRTVEVLPADPKAPPLFTGSIVVVHQ